MAFLLYLGLWSPPRQQGLLQQVVEPPRLVSFLPFLALPSARINQMDHGDGLSFQMPIHGFPTSGSVNMLTEIIS